MEDEPYPMPSTDPSLEQNLYHRPEAPTEHDGAADGGRRRPGSDGEHEIQRQIGTTQRADRFYDTQMLDHLNANMREFVAEQEMFFLATSDAKGECDNTFRAGPPGFLRVLDEKTLVFPEYRGNGVHASLGNIRENPHLGILLVDFVRARIGLHINGRARIVTDANIRAAHPDLPRETVPGRRAELWVQVDVEEAYIHCAKHIPQLQKAPKGTPRDWGTDDPTRKGGDYFGVARDRASGTRDKAAEERSGTLTRLQVRRSSRAPGDAGADAWQDAEFAARARSGVRITKPLSSGPFSSAPAPGPAQQPAEHPQPVSEPHTPPAPDDTQLPSSEVPFHVVAPAAQAASFDHLPTPGDPSAPRATGPVRRTPNTAQDGRPAPSPDATIPGATAPIASPEPPAEVQGHGELRPPEPVLHWQEEARRVLAEAEARAQAVARNQERPQAVEPPSGQALPPAGPPAEGSQGNPPEGAPDSSSPPVFQGWFAPSN